MIQNSRSTELMESGHSILAEIYRLSDCVPRDFMEPNSSKFKLLLSDFSYLDEISVINVSSVNLDEQSSQLEEEFFCTFADVIMQFGLLFDTLGQFLSHIIGLSQNHCSGRDLASASSSRLVNQCYRSEAEALYITGLIVLALTSKFSCGARQRLFIAYYRSNPSNIGRCDVLVDILKIECTNYAALFEMVPVNHSFAENIVLALRSEALFGDENEYSPVDNFIANRVSRTQRAVITICLFFAPSILSSNLSMMRQIVDIYYYEEWVIPLHLGMVLNIVHAWEKFKAADSVLLQIITIQSAKEVANGHLSHLEQIRYPHVTNITIANFMHCSNLIFMANQHLRWIILHTYKEKIAKRATHLCTTVSNQLGLSSDDIFKKFIELSKFEYDFKKVYKDAIDTKQSSVENLKLQICQHISQMAEMFAAGIPLQKIKKNTKLQNWFLLIIEKIKDFDIEDSEASSIIEHVKGRIEQVSELHDLCANVAISQYLQHVLTLLTEILYYCTINEHFSVRIDSSSDFSYGWTIVNQWQSQMELLIQKDILPICAFFYKISSSIELALPSALSPNRLSTISSCYSHQLERQLRTILQVVPRSLFTHLTQITDLLDPPISATVNKSDIRSFVDHDRRFKLAEITFAISKISLGITTAQLTSLGSIRINTSLLLHDGIRSQLLYEISSVLHAELSKSHDWSLVMKNVNPRIEKLRKAFIYICDHIALNGSLIWQDEIQRFIVSMLEKETKLYLRKGACSVDYTFHSVSVCTPSTTPIFGSVTCIHRLFTLFVTATDPQITYYENSRHIWCDVKSKNTVFSNELLSSLQSALSPMILLAIDSIVCFSIIKELKYFHDLFSKIITQYWSDMFSDISHSKARTTGSKSKYDTLLTKFVSRALPFIIALSKIGQLQLLRMKINEVIEASILQRAPYMYKAVSVLNRSVINELNFDEKKLNSDILKQLEKLLRRFAIVNPLKKVFTRRNPPESIIEVLFITFLIAVQKVGATRRVDSIDALPIIVGFSSIINQYQLHDAFFSACNHYLILISDTVRTVQCQRLEGPLKLLARYSLLSCEELGNLVPLLLTFSAE